LFFILFYFKTAAIFHASMYSNIKPFQNYVEVSSGFVLKRIMHSIIITPLFEHSDLSHFKYTSHIIIKTEQSLFCLFGNAIDDLQKKLELSLNMINTPTRLLRK
jgi:hypothetical protein